MRKYRLDIFAAVWIPYALLVYRFRFVTDDAYISFRYARNLIDGLGLRFNPGAHLPVEGYSNFLWIMLCSVFEFFRMDITLWPSLVSFACGSVLLWLVFDTLRRRLEIHPLVAGLATLSLGCFPPFALWSTGGLATMPFALLVFITFERLVLRRGAPDGIGAGIAGLLLALIRLEGIAWVAVLLILTLISRRLAGERKMRPLIVCGLIVGVGFAIYFAWRYWYYQMPLPNTAYAKANLDALRLTRGLMYVVSFALVFVTPILILPGSILALRLKRIVLGLPVATMAWGFSAYAVLVTGDFMVMGRFLIPGLAFATILLAWMLSDLWAAGWFRRVATVLAALLVIAIGLLPGWDQHLIPAEIRAKYRFRHNSEEFKSEYAQWRAQMDNTETWKQRGKALRYYAARRNFPEPYPSYIAGAIGANGYYSDLFIFDRHGLVIPDISHRPFEPEAPLRSPGHDKQVPKEYFLKDRPTIYFATVVTENDPRVFAGICKREERALRNEPPRLQLDRQYVVDFERLPDTAAKEQNYIITWTRIADGVTPQAAWADFQQRLRQLSDTDDVKRSTESP